eukprot:4094183-Amphidinium_carterae.1
MQNLPFSRQRRPNRSCNALQPRRWRYHPAIGEVNEGTMSDAYTEVQETISSLARCKAQPGKHCHPHTTLFFASFGFGLRRVASGVLPTAG